MMIRSLQVAIISFIHYVGKLTSRFVDYLPLLEIFLKMLDRELDCFGDVSLDLGHREVTP